jgi:predicted metal-dependent hydrolase
VRNRRARRYVLRVDRSGRVRVTIPRGGSETFARQFAAEKAEWIRAQLERVAAGPQPPRVWVPGTEVWYRGERLPLQGMPGLGRLGDETFVVPASECDWRPFVENHLKRLAERELPRLVLDLAATHDLVVRRVAVRSQRTRWGSCSRKGTISLNWRLVQAPVLVRDYLIAHELAHLREMNHSSRFWRILQGMFPAWREAERWLKQHGRDLLG